MNPAAGRSLSRVGLDGTVMRRLRHDHDVRHAAMRSAMARGLVEVMYHAMTRTASVGTALAAVIVGLEGVTMTFLKREREKGRREGRREGRLEGRREGMRERDREWKDWQQRLKKDPNAKPPPPPKDDD